MKVLFLSSEVSPFSKSGGLADVAGALPEAIASTVHDHQVDIRVVTTAFGGIRRLDGITLKKDINFELPSGMGKTEVFTAQTAGGVPVTFLNPGNLFERPGLYGENGLDYPDNFERFLLWSYAVRGWVKDEDFFPDIVHGNDWQTGLFMALMEYWRETDKEWKTAASLFTIHNLAYKGLFSIKNLPLTGLPPSYGHFSRLEFYGKMAFIKGGICCSDMISTVSPSYREEVLDEPLGEGLSGALVHRKEQFIGILNGIDDTVWNPENDSFLRTPYSLHDLSGKADSKKELLEAFGLDPTFSGPLFGMVTRLTGQKGVDLALEGVEKLLETGVDFRLVILGSGDPPLEEKTIRLSRDFGQKVAVRIGFDDPLAHRIMAGSDFFLMPSRFEPCGLSQMYAMKYGTIPVVNPTGGLKDTVNPSEAGIWLDDLTEAGVMAGIRKAIGLFQDKARLKKQIVNAMRKNNSWKARAGDYVEAYRKAIGNRRKITGLSSQPGSP